MRAHFGRQNSTSVLSSLQPVPSSHWWLLLDTSVVCQIFLNFYELKCLTNSATFFQWPSVTRCALFALLFVIQLSRIMEKLLQHIIQAITPAFPIFRFSGSRSRKHAYNGLAYAHTSYKHLTLPINS